MSPPEKLTVFCVLAVLILFYSNGSIAGEWLERHAEAETGAWSKPIINGKNTEAASEAFIEDYYPEIFQHKQSELKLINKTESAVGFHLLFEQTWYGISVYGSQVKLNINREGVPLSIFAKVHDVSGWPDKDALYAGNEPIAAIPQDENIREQEKVLFIQAGGIPELAFKIRVYDEEKHVHEEVIRNLSGALLYSRDLFRYDHLTEVEAAVFYPNPLISADAQYGGPFIHNDNRDTAALNDERETVFMEVYSAETDTLYLKGPHVEIQDFSAPHNDPAQSTDSSFVYKRSQPWFEETMAYYHIHTYKKYLDSLGYDDLPLSPVYVDARALGGADQSLYDPYDHRIYLGTGGVPDAEDADVIIHEYIHALASTAAPGTFQGHERMAVEEGASDYFACSYRRALQPVVRNDLFSWDSGFRSDGANEYWPGRKCMTNKTYPDDVTPSVHATGEIWSSMLMDVYEELGRETTDRLMLTTLYSLSSNMSMRSVAELFLQSDSLLFKKENEDVIKPILVQRGLMEEDAPNLLAGRNENGQQNCYDPVIQYVNNDPVTKKLEVELSLPFTGSIGLYDLSGRKLTKQEKQVDVAENMQIKTGDLQQGIYIITFRTEDCFNSRKLMID